MRWVIFLVAFLVLATSVLALGRYIELRPLDPPDIGSNNTMRWGTGDYRSPWLRKPNYVFNFTVDYSKLPWPKIDYKPPGNPGQTTYDTVRNSTSDFNPETCPGEIAQCYDFRKHEFGGVILRGKNYSGISDYILPEDRVRFFVCIGNDTECTSKAEGCYCPLDLPKIVPLPDRVVDCPLEGNICQVTESGALTTCKMNFTACRETYDRCACGRTPFCNAGTETTCVNFVDELEVCNGVLSDCLERNEVCFCGKEMQALQLGCLEKRNKCIRDEEEVICYGSFGDCVVRNDQCRCGIE